MIRNHFSTLLLAVVATSAVTAQAPLVRISVAGPESVRRAILPTNVGSLLGDREVESVSNLLRGQLHGLVRSLGNDESAETAESIERSLLGYRGRIETEVFVTPGGRDAEFAVEGHMVWLDDEETELGKLCADLESIARGALGDGLRAVEVEGHSYTVLESHDGGVSLPALDADGNAVLYFGSDPTSAIANGVARRERNRESDLARVAAISPFDLLSIDVDLERVIALSRTGHSDSSAEQLMARVFGFGTYRHARASVSTNGPHLQFELAVSFGPGHRGIYEAFLPSIETLPHMLESLPLPADRAPVFACGHVRWRELWEVILDFAANFSLFQSKTRGLDEIRDTANEDAGFDIENDLLASVGTEFGVVYDLGVTRDAQDRADPDADGMCLVFEIRDDKAFDAVFEKLRGSPLRIDGKTEHAGTAIYSGRFLDRDEHFAHVPGRFLYAFGPRGLGVLERAIDRPADAPGSPPDALRNVRRSAPPGWNLAASVPADFFGDTLFEEILWETWKEIRRELPGQASHLGREDLDAALRRVLPVLTEHRLDRIALLGGFADGEMRLRAIW